MSSESTHPSLLERVGDPENREAWRDFDRRYGPLILHYCRRLGLQLADAEDIRQDVMISLAGALRQFEYDPARGRFRSYLGRAVRNAVVRHVRRHARAAACLDAHVIAAIAAGSDDVERVWEDEWVRHHCRMALASVRRALDVRHVEIFERLLEGRPVALVAEEMEMTPEAVRKIKERVGRRLREIVARQIRDEAPPP